jgi:hypothetical protein
MVPFYLTVAGFPKPCGATGSFKYYSTEVVTSAVNRLGDTECTHAHELWLVLIPRMRNFILIGALYYPLYICMHIHISTHGRELAMTFSWILMF